MEHLRILQNVSTINNQLSCNQNENRSNGARGGLGVEGYDLMLDFFEWEALWRCMGCWDSEMVERWDGGRRDEGYEWMMADGEQVELGVYMCVGAIEFEYWRNCIVAMERLIKGEREFDCE